MTTPPPSVQQPAHQPPSGNGGWAWLCGLIVVLCIPFVSSLAASALMMAVGLAQRGKGELAADNGVRAANWGLTYGIATIVLGGIHFGLLWFLTRDGSTIEGFLPFGLPILIFVLLTLVHIAVCIRGGIVATQNRSFDVNGIPFFRS